MSEIYDFPFSFNILKKYITFTFKRYYGEFIVIGKENIPADCPIIFAPNHTNALMDALAVHIVAPNGIPVIFLARADIFKNRTLAKILNFMKIMPAFRMRDGVENLGKNSEIFDCCIEVLNHNKALGIMPEGNQEIERKLRPLVKGIFRIAFATQQKHGNTPTVKIIPIGLDFGDTIKFGKHIIITISKPIEVSDYMDEYAINPVIATNQIRDRLRDDLSAISLNLATDKYYESFEIATEVCNTAILDKLKLPNYTVNRYVARLKIADKLVEIEKKEPSKAELLDAYCSEYSNILKEINLHNWVLEQAPFKSFTLISDGLLLFWTVPLFVIGSILNFLPFFLPVFLREKVFKTEFKGFFSSLQYALGIIIFPIFYIIQTFLFIGLTGYPWWMGTLFFFVQYPFGKWALKWNSIAKKLKAKYRFNKLTRLNSNALKQAQELRKQIIDLVVIQ